MQVLTEIVRNLLVIIIIASLLEVLLPEGTTRPLVRFVVGMFVLVAILAPSLDHLFGAGSFRISAWNDRNPSYDFRHIDSTGTRIQEQIKKQSDSLLQRRLEEQVSAVAILVPGVDDVKAGFTLDQNGNLHKLRLIVRSSTTLDPGRIRPVEVWAEAGSGSAADRDGISGKMTRIMTSLYGLKAEDIEIVFEGS